MINRLGLVVGSLAASAVLAVALFAAGFAPGAPRTVASSVGAAAQPTPVVQVNTIYVKPAPSQQVIQVQAGGTAQGEGGEGSEGSDHD